MLAAHDLAKLIKDLIEASLPVCLGTLIAAAIITALTFIPGALPFSDLAMLPNVRAWSIILTVCSASAILAHATRYIKVKFEMIKARNLLIEDLGDLTNPEARVLGQFSLVGGKRLVLDSTSYALVLLEAKGIVIKTPQTERDGYAEYSLDPNVKIYMERNPLSIAPLETLAEIALEQGEEYADVAQVYKELIEAFKTKQARIGAEQFKRIYRWPLPEQPLLLLTNENDEN